MPSRAADPERMGSKGTLRRKSWRVIVTANRPSAKWETFRPFRPSARRRGVGIVPPTDVTATTRLRCLGWRDCRCQPSPKRRETVLGRMGMLYFDHRIIVLIKFIVPCIKEPLRPILWYSSIACPRRFLHGSSRIPVESYDRQKEVGKSGVREAERQFCACSGSG